MGDCRQKVAKIAEHYTQVFIELLTFQARLAASDLL
jgi:hypothetical protein